jgi:hypothetical protein
MPNNNDQCNKNLEEALESRDLSVEQIEVNSGGISRFVSDAPHQQISSPDPFDPAQFAASSTVYSGIGITRELVACPVRKPNKQEFVRVHTGAEYRLSAHILELKMEGEVYLVMPSLAAELDGETRAVSLRLAVNRQGAVFLWPVPEPRIDGREIAWHTSARTAADKAETHWVRIIANMHQGCYDVWTAPGDLGTPAWPNVKMRDLIELAFGEKHIIRDAGHPVIRRLLGRP